MADEYYNSIAEGYDELHEAEQIKKLAIVKKELDIRPDTKLLDVGCGTGISSQFDCNVVGVDPSKDLLSIAKRKFPKTAFKQASAESLPFANHTFDIVISLTAIQNFTSIKQGINEIKRVGKKQFALTFLKKSGKAKMIEAVINQVFSGLNIKRIEEEKDIIVIIKE